MNAARKWSDTLFDYPSHPKRKSSVGGHENSKGRHDIYLDNRLRAFKDAARDAFNDEYSFNSRLPRDVNKGLYQMEFDTDNIGNQGYYDSIGTETQVPTRKAVIGKTVNGDRTKSILQDRFYMDSLDGSDPYPGKRHQAQIGFDRQHDYKRDAVEPNMDKWDYMQARNRGNQEILDYVNGKYKYIKGKGWSKK